MIWGIIILSLICIILFLILFLKGIKKVEVKSNVIVNRLEKIAELSTAKLTITHVFETETSVLMPGASKHFILIVPVSVRGYLNLKNFSNKKIEVIDEETSRRVKVTLPVPELEISIPQSNIKNIQVINQSGFLVKTFGNRDMLRVLKENSEKMEKEVREQAYESGILETSRESARNFFHGFLLGMGFDEVVILFEEKKEEIKSKSEIFVED